MLDATNEWFRCLQVAGVLRQEIEGLRSKYAWSKFSEETGGDVEEAISRVRAAVLSSRSPDLELEISASTIVDARVQLSDDSVYFALSIALMSMNQVVKLLGHLAGESPNSEPSDRS